MMFDELIPGLLVMSVKRSRDLKRSLFSFLFCVPTSLLALLLLVLLAYNGVSVYYVHVPLLAPEPANFSRQNQTDNLSSLSSPKTLGSGSGSGSSSVMYVVREQNSPMFLKTQFPNLRKQENSLKLSKNLDEIASSARRPRRVGKVKHKQLRSFEAEELSDRRFSSRIKEFFGSGNCTRPRFFMTWISSLDSFGERELFAVESLFKTHPNSCLAIVSRAMDSEEGSEILRPFRESGFKVIAVSPDYDFAFRNTPAEAWFNGLRRGHVKPGEIALGQNLSNLLRLCLLYKFGGVYADTDVIFLKSFSRLRNTIGAQSIHPDTRDWSRLNNAVLVFDKNHPLLLKFIEEFALTFDGNKWGHNGPYLVSRVVSRLGENPGFRLSILPPTAFYPVDWRRIRGLFRSPDGEDDQHRKWRLVKMSQIQSNSYAIHLWNRQSKRLKVESGSVIDTMKKDLCVFCNSVNNSSLVSSL